MKFEYILPALRAGKKVRRAKWDASDCIAETSGRFYVRPCARSRGLDAEDINAKDWEVMPEPKRVADYFCPVFGLDLIDPPYYKETHEVGKQPEGAVLIPGTERTEESREAVPGSERELGDPFALTPEERANLGEEDGQ